MWESESLELYRLLQWSFRSFTWSINQNTSCIVSYCQYVFLLFFILDNLIDLTLLDRYLVSAVFLIRQYYLYSIQQACFSIILVCKEKQIALETISDYHSLCKSPILREWLQEYNKWNLQAFNIMIAYKHEIADVLVNEGVGDCL